MGQQRQHLLSVGGEMLSWEVTGSDTGRWGRSAAGTVKTCTHKLPIPDPKSLAGRQFLHSERFQLWKDTRHTFPIPH